MKLILSAMLACLLAPAAWAGAEPKVAFALKDHRLDIAIGGQPFAAYIWQDPKIRRPFFAHVRAPGGQQITRNHPPVAGKDATDHDTMHPGIWLAFGDLGGADFWRNQATVQHVEFSQKPKGGPGAGSFTVKNQYQAKEKTLAEETCAITILIRPAGYLLLWDSTFATTTGFAFGDQEEMGLGVRLATPLTVKQGGQISNSAGQKNEKQTWGQKAEWCAYQGRIDGKSVGVLLMPDPRNFRPSWFHSRDYGLLVANPFGQQAFTRKNRSRIQVSPGETFRLRFGVVIFSGDLDLAEVYQDFLRISGVPEKF